MAFSNSFLEQIKERISVSSIVSKYVVWDNKKSNQTKRDFWAPCPFHNEKTASFHVDDNKAFYYCFGCQTKGNIFNFLKEKEGLSFQEAVKTLAEKAGLNYELETKDGPNNRLLEKKLAVQTELINIHHEASEFFTERLFSSQGMSALNYLKERGLSENTIKEFNIGYAPKDGKGLTKNLNEKGFSSEKIYKAGLSLISEENNRFERFRDRIMFPILNSRNKIVAFGGRALKDAAGAKYLNSSETEIFKKGSIVFNLNNARKHLKENNLIIVEGYMDVISLSNSSIKTAVAPLGTALTEKQLSLVWDFCEEPTLLFDGDKAGLAATDRVIELALPFLTHNKTLRIARPKDNFDPDDILRLEGKDAILELVKNSKSIIDSIFEKEKDIKPIDSPERLRNLEINLKKKAHKIKDLEVRRLFLYQFGAKLRELNYFSNAKGDKKSKRKKHFYSDLKTKESSFLKLSEGELEKIEAGIIYCLAKNPHLIKEIGVKLSELNFQDSLFKKIFWQLKDRFEENFSVEFLTKVEVKTLQKDPLLKGHLIYNNDKEVKKSKELLLNNISTHNLALNRLQRLKDLKIKLKSHDTDSKDESESLERAQNRYQKAISGQKYVKEIAAKEKQSYKENLDQLSDRIKQKKSEK